MKKYYHLQGPSGEMFIENDTESCIVVSIPEVGYKTVNRYNAAFKPENKTKYEKLVEIPRTAFYVELNEAEKEINQLKEYTP